VKPLVRLAIEAGPLVVFLFANGRYGLFAGTAAFMAATVASLIAAWLVERRVPVVPLATGAFVLVFGGLTLALQDELFIKLKPTIVNTLFALILAGGMLAGRSLLKPVFGAVFSLDETGWRALTWRWAGFFLLMAVLNEIVWRTQSTEFWISYKLLGAMPLTLLFSVAQLPLIKRHMLPETDEATAPARADG
jgi:intracellular septation protein